MCSEDLGLKCISRHCILCYLPSCALGKNSKTVVSRFCIKAVPYFLRITFFDYLIYMSKLVFCNLSLVHKQYTIK